LRYFRFRYSFVALMDPLEQATELLRETEARLRELVSTAATSGDYNSVVQIAAWARTLAELMKAAGPTDEKQTTAVLRTMPPAAVGQATVENVIKQVSSRAWRKAYPKFFRQQDELIRVAWSKREKREYRHKAPRWVLKALVEAMAQKGVNGRVFSSDQLLPIQVGTDHGEIPTYQAYVGISLLKQTGLIDQHGRSGYSIARRLTDFIGAVEAVWNKLPELRN
jgi:hypothetical protein